MPYSTNNILTNALNSKIALLLVVMFLSIGISYSTVVTATGNGKWTSGGTWDTGTPPACGDTIIIPSSYTVTVDVQVNIDGCPDPSFLLVEGTLDFKNGKKLYMSAGSGVTVAGSGQITGGGGGSANVINIGGTDVWNSGGGNITTPTTLGQAFGVLIKSITTGDFFNPSTWDCSCVPDSLNTTIIRAVDEVTVSGSAYVYTMDNRGSLIVLGSNKLTINGTWINNGIFTPNQSTISFGGSGDQGIAGVRNQEFYNIHIKNNCVLTNNAGLLNLRGIMTFNNGSFITSDSLNLISDGSGTGAIGSLSSGSFSGNVISNRYVMSGATDWRFLTSCIQGATLADIDDDIVTSGISGSDYPSFPFISIWGYDETVLGNKDSGFVAPSSTSQAIAAGQGYWVFAGDNLSGTAAFNIDFYGAINQGAINLPVSYTVTPDLGDGWNLVANPYPCAIDWDDPNWTKLGISDETHIFDPNTGTYAVYAGGVSANGGSNIIASNQAFWIKAVSPVLQLTATEGCKATDNSDPFKAYTQPSNLRIFCKKNRHTTFSDEIVLKHNANTSQNKVLGNKLLSTNDSILNIMFVDDNISSSIFEIPNSFDTLPLKLVGNSQQVIISFKDVDFSSHWWSVYLYDNATQNKYPIDGDASFVLNKSVSSVNLDLSLILVPKVEFTSEKPLCKYSENGFIETSVIGFDDYLALTNSSNAIILPSSSGSWLNLTRGEYSMHVSHPIDSTLYYDSIFDLSPINAKIDIIENNVLDAPQDLEISDVYLSNYWLFNGLPIANNVDGIELNQISAHDNSRNTDLIQCVYIDPQGCEKAYTWTIYTIEGEKPYPNPYSNNNALNVYVSKGNNSIEIFTLAGQIAWSGNLLNDAAGYQKIQGLELAKGQYLMKISSQETTVNFKLVVNE